MLWRSWKIILPRLLLLVSLSLFFVHVALALRLPSLEFIKPRRSSTRASDDVFRDVLSSQSTLHASLAPGLGAHADDTAAPFEALGDVELAPAARLRDPWLATVFSTQAAKRLPRFAQGPSVTLAPLQQALPGIHQQLPQHQYPQHHQHDQQNQQQHGAAAAAGRGGGGGGAGAGAGRPAVGAADPPHPDFNPDEALLAGRLASIAYCSHPDLLAAWNCSRCAAVPGFVPYRVVYDAVWDLAAYVGYYPAWDAVVLSFRGTDSSNWGQWAENMRAWRTDHMYPVPNFPHALIHAGFYTLWTLSTLQASFTSAVLELMSSHPRARLVATGHSMGGALAQLAGLELKLTHNTSRASVYTFGAPRVGNLAYQQLFNSFIDVSWRFTHNRDIVPSVPLQLMGFMHVAREVWEVDVEDPSGSGGVERKLLLCDGSGEDPSCHNSACYLGLCTSIADHLTYLGLNMYQDGEEC